MSEVRIGSWIVDLSRGTATEGDITVTIVPEGSQTFSLRFSGPLSVERQEALKREVLSIFERAKVLIERQGSA